MKSSLWEAGGRRDLTGWLQAPGGGRQREEVWNGKTLGSRESGLLGVWARLCPWERGSGREVGDVTALPAENLA